MPAFEFNHDERGGVLVLRDGHPQSYVDPTDPLFLAFEYVQCFATAAGTLPAGPLAVTHVGGAGLTFARYLNAVRPGSTQIVLEPDALLTETVRRELPLPRQHRIRVRPVDGRSGLGALKAGSADLIVIDAYAEGVVPADLTWPSTTARLADIARPGALVLWNLADQPSRHYLRRVLATIRISFPHSAILTTTEVAKGKRFGNYVVIGSASPLEETALTRAAAGSPLPTTYLDARHTAKLAGSAAPISEGEDVRSPLPPSGGLLHFR